MSTAAAPSLRGDALPAVIAPSGRKDGFSWDNDCTVLSGLMLSSRVSSEPCTTNVRSS
jgi:hypothetical protein